MLDHVIFLIRQYLGHQITFRSFFQKIFEINRSNQFRESLFSVFLLGGLSQEFLLNNSDKNYTQSKNKKNITTQKENEKRKGAWTSKVSLNSVRFFTN